MCFWLRTCYNDGYLSHLRSVGWSFRYPRCLVNGMVVFGFTTFKRRTVANVSDFFCCRNGVFFATNTSSTAQGGGGSFKNRKPIGAVGCCESGMAERSHWRTERCLRSPLFLWLSTYLPIYFLCIYLSVDLAIYLSLSLFHLITYLPIYLSTYLSISLSLSFICLSV